MEWLVVEFFVPSLGNLDELLLLFNSLSRVSLSLGKLHKVVHVFTSQRVKYVEKELTVYLLTLWVLRRNVKHELFVMLYVL